MAPVWPNFHRIDAGCVIFIDRIDNAQQELLPDEQYLLNGVTRARERELRAGRSTARRALALLGHPAQPIHSQSSGAPAWPAGTSGSISHSREHIAVIAASAEIAIPLGIDIDDGRPLSPDAARDVATASELNEIVLAGWTPSLEAAACLAFSAKEAFFKCQFAVTGNGDLSFSDVALSANTSGTGLSIRPISDQTPEFTAFASEIIINNIFIQGLTIVHARAKHSCGYIV